MKAKKEAKQLIEEFEFGVRDLDGEVSLTMDEAKMCALICVSKQFELLRYLGSKTPEELYDELVKQKVALKDNFN